METEKTMMFFVHHTGVNVASEQYKYLVQGEYVNFSVKKTDNTDHPYQACDVRGVLDGLLMCETRHDIRKSTQEYNQTKRKTRRGGGGPRDDENENVNDQWVVENRGGKGSGKRSSQSRQ
jgi:hypothetical protein